MTEHTIVVRFPEGAAPAYSAATEFQGGQVVAVAFDGNRLAIEQELQDALDALLDQLSDIEHADVVIQARAALDKAQGVTS